MFGYTSLVTGVWLHEFSHTSLVTGVERRVVSEDVGLLAETEISGGGRKRETMPKATLSPSE